MRAPTTTSHPPKQTTSTRKRRTATPVVKPSPPPSLAGVSISSEHINLKAQQLFEEEGKQDDETQILDRVRTQRMEVIFLLLLFPYHHYRVSPFSLTVCACSTLFLSFPTILQPCASARLFACYALWCSSTSNATAETGNAPTSGESGTSSSSHVGSASLDSILPLLQALVRVESVSLGPSNNSPSPKKTRRVHFSGLVTQPPVDRELASAEHQQESIEAMMHAKKQIQSLKSTAIPAIQQLRDFLSSLSSSDDNQQLLQTIASAIGPDFPSKRVSVLADVCLGDFEILGRRLSNVPHDDVVMSPLQQQMMMMRSSSSSSNDPLTSVEQRLTALLGQGIRFQLRMLLNEAPPRLSKVNEAYDEMAEKAYSKVSELVQPPVNEGLLSAPFSTALLRLHEYFGLEKLMDSSSSTTDPVLMLPTEFCSSAASQRQLSVRGKTFEPLTEQDKEAVMVDIRAAASFLAAARAARFLVDLLSAPGVQKEIKRMGGWSEIETYASCSWNYDLWKHKAGDGDAHLVVLCNVAALHKRLQSYCTAMEALTDDCEASLAQLHSNFHLATKSKIFLNKYPAVPEIADCHEFWMNLASAFPEIESSSSS